MKRVRKTASPEETQQLAAQMARLLRGGELLALMGELGSGKTCFVQGLAQGLEVRAQVTSPSFVLCKSYRGRFTLHHLDFYRLSSQDDFLSLGIDELLSEDTVVAVEWAERLSSFLPQDIIKIEFEIEGETERMITFEWKETQFDYLREL